MSLEADKIYQQLGFTHAEIDDVRGIAEALSPSEAIDILKAFLENHE